MAISLVQQAGGIDSSGSVGSVSVAFASPPTAGNMLYAAITSGNGAANTNLTGFSDTNSNTWTKIIDANTNQADGIQVWVAYNCKGGATTVSVSDAGFASAMAIGEVSGLATSAAFDQSVITDVSGTSPSSGTTAALSTANEFVLAVVASGSHNGNAYSVGTGYSNFLSEAGQWVVGGFESKIVSSTAGVSASFGGGTAATGNKIAVMTFKAASGGTQYTQSLSATLSFTGGLSRKTSRSLAGGLSFTGAIAKRTNRSLAATLTFVGSLTKQTRRALAAGLSFSGALAASHVIIKTLSASLGFSGALNRRTNRPLAASLTPSGQLTKQTNKSLPAALTFTGNLNKQISRFLAASLTFTGNLALVKTIQSILLKILNLFIQQPPSLALTLQVPAALSLTLQEPQPMAMSMTVPAPIPLTATVPASILQATQLPTAINLTLTVPGSIDFTVLGT